MSQNVFGVETVRQLDVLIKELGLTECKRLEFIHEDEQGIMRLSTAGLGYLLSVKAAEVTTLAAAFAAGRRCAFDEIEDRS